MSKRNKKGQYKTKHSPAFIATSWISSFASIGVLYFAGSTVIASLGSFRSCDSNNSGLKIVSCGKQSINAGDLAMVVFLILSAALVASLFTASWRMTRKPVS